MPPMPDNLIMFLAPRPRKLAHLATLAQNASSSVGELKRVVLCPPFFLHHQHSLNSLKIRNLLGPEPGLRNVRPSALALQ